ELGVEDVERDDLPRAADARALDDRQPHAATAEHRHRLTGLEPRAPERGTHSREHAASDERSPVERQAWVDPDEGVLVEQHPLGEAADADHRLQRLAVLQQSRRVRLAAVHDATDAEVRVTGEALRATPAEAGEAGHDVIA